MTKQRRIVHVSEVPVHAMEHGDTYRVERAMVGLALDSERLGYNVAVIPPGKRGFPLHAHYGNEEMYFILEGRGSVRLGEETHPVRAGDFVCVPAGPDYPHQLINDSDAPLRYLAVSTMQHPDVVIYPESGKLGAFAGAAPGRRDEEQRVLHFCRLADRVDFWADED